jgi:hypothetical protein
LKKAPRVLLIHVSALLKGHMQNILRDPTRHANQNINSDTVAMAEAVKIFGIPHYY